MTQRWNAKYRVVIAGVLVGVLVLWVGVWVVESFAVVPFHAVDVDTKEPVVWSSKDSLTEKERERLAEVFEAYNVRYRLSDERILVTPKLAWNRDLRLNYTRKAHIEVPKLRENQ